MALPHGLSTPAMNSKGSPFHPAVEGLRALAVLSVVLAHAHVPGFAGGFIGVDVFFVISGFLICRLLLNEIEHQGQIDLARFWARRVRRLLPNATLTLITTLAIGLLVIPGFMRADVARDVTMAAFQISNFHFASTAVDYFRQDNPQSPVLHFWSLAVEEHFYIVWPVLLAMLCLLLRRRAAMVSRYLILGIVILSFAGMLHASTISQPVAFFHSWARAWQIGLGGLVAVLFNMASKREAALFARGGGRLHMLHGLGWLGLATVLACVLLFNDGMVYPGLAALLPTVGAAVMIACVTLLPAHSWSIATPLSVHGLQWIGARSYSWYLWHWPMLILAEYAYPEVPGIRIFGALAGIGIGSVVYTAIEEPIRRGQVFSAAKGRTLLAGFSSMVLVAAAAAAFARVPPPGGAEIQAREARMKEAASDLGAVYADKCHLDVEIILQPTCEYGVANGQRRAVLFGDSHAAQWFSAIQKAALGEGWSFRSWTKSSCPSIEVSMWYPPRKAGYGECDAWRQDVMARLTGPERPDVVFISNLQDYTGWIEDPASPGKLLRRTEAQELFREGTERMIRRFVDAGVAVVVIRDTPRMIRSVATCYVRSGGPACDSPRERALAQSRIDVEAARAFPPAANVRSLDLTDRICEPNVCRVERNGTVIWRDSHHVRSSFALEHSDHFRDILRSFAPGAQR